MTSGINCLTELALDLQILICEFLNPLHILALRQTCKAFQQVTSNRIIWINALMRICRKNMLFLPSFSMPDMSVGQLERAAAAPFRWIALSSKDTEHDIPSHSISRIRIDTLRPMVDDFQYLEYSDDRQYHAYSDEDDDDERKMLSLYLYLVPGGRYLVTHDDQSLSVLDLGCASDEDMSSDRRLARVWSTRVQTIRNFHVHPTFDGMGIRILILLTGYELAVFEIYPQSENPKLVRIAEMDCNLEEYPDCGLYGDRVVIFCPNQNIIIVWDFVANTIASACVDVPDWPGDRLTELIGVTESAIIVLDIARGLRVLILSMPILITRTPLFDIHRDIQRIVPIFTFKHPEIQTMYDCLRPDCWYHGVLSSPLYILSSSLYDLGGEAEICHKLEFSPDLSHMSATPIQVGNPQWQSNYLLYIYEDQRPAYKICEDSSATLQDCCSHVMTISDSSQTGSTYLGNATRLGHEGELRSFCPVSARLVCTDSQSGHIVISDFCR